MEYKLIREQILNRGFEEALDKDLIKILMGCKTYEKISSYKPMGLEDLKYVCEEEVEYLTRLEKDKVMALKELMLRGIPVSSGTKISGPKDINNLLDDIRYLDQEHFIVFCLNTKNVVVSKKAISVGTLNNALVHPREVFKEAIKKSAANIVLAHNHPSFDPSPSKEDVDISLRLRECGKLIGIDVLDHVIVGGKNFISLKEKGVI